MDQAEEHALLVAGAGPVGASLALAVARAGIPVTLVRSGTPAGVEPVAASRPIALSASSCRILRTLGVWQHIAPRACPIRMVHVSEKGRFGMVRLRAEEQGVAALGHVTDAATIAAALEPSLAATAGLTCIGPARVRDARVTGDGVQSWLEPAHDEVPGARLLAVADGGESGLRERLGVTLERREYRQRAVVCNVVPGRPHEGVAYERFTPTGPVALLPLPGDECALVWTLPDALARDVEALSDRAFLDALQRAFGNRLGRLGGAGPRHGFPLELIRARPLTMSRVVLVGNAAHQLHPVAGQGLNLGLRDAAVLAELVVQAVRTGHDPGAADVLAAYRKRRLPEQRAVVRFTDLLARGFTLRGGGLGMVRSAAMLGIDLFPPAGRALARRAMGLAGRQPRLVRGLLP